MAFIFSQISTIIIILYLTHAHYSTHAVGIWCEMRIYIIIIIIISASVIYYNIKRNLARPITGLFAHILYHPINMLHVIYHFHIIIPRTYRIIIADSMNDNSAVTVCLRQTEMLINLYIQYILHTCSMIVVICVNIEYMCMM